MKVSIIIPCYEEEKTIKDVLDQILQINLGCEKEIIVVDDGSKDKTSQIVKEYSEVRLIQHDSNMGKGAAIRSGLKRSTGDLLVIQDADLEYHPSQLPNLINLLIERKAHAVFGSRFLKHSKRLKMKLTHYIANKILSWTTSVLYKQKITDVMTGHEAFLSEAIASVQLEEERFAIEVEIAARLLERGFKIEEVPINYCARESGAKIRWIHFFKCLFWLVRHKF